MGINEKLLKEELKKHKLLYEYDFFDARDTVDTDIESDEELVLGEVPGDEPIPDDAEDTDGLEDSEEGSDEKEDFEDKPIDLDSGDDFGEFDDEPLDEPLPEEPAEDEVEIDITDLVKDNEETKNIANSANQKMDILMSKFSELQGSLQKMDSISKKIEDMEIEIDKRMPSEEEKLEMRSLDSYPYSLKLTDYWSEKKGKYDVMDTDDDEKELVLTQQDVEGDYNSNTIQDSFNDFEEEDITY